MGINVVWDNPQQTVIMLQCEGALTPQDYYKAIDSAYLLVTSVAHTVDFIYDRSQVTEVPQQISRIAQHAGKRMIANMGIIVIVQPEFGTHIRLQLVRVVAPLVIKNLHFADTVAEARHNIESYHNRGLPAVAGR
ncbi:MAG: hypothetical protein H7Y11_03925 [Armatimonadetes bacterium]|nr:hypothetical protein [Anaerolineae bacterium]